MWRQARLRFRGSWIWPKKRSSRGKEWRRRVTRFSASASLSWPEESPEECEFIYCCFGDLILWLFWFFLWITAVFGLTGCLLQIGDNCAWLLEKQNKINKFIILNLNWSKQIKRNCKKLNISLRVWINWDDLYTLVF